MQGAFYGIAQETSEAFGVAEERRWRESCPVPSLPQARRRCPRAFAGPLVRPDFERAMVPSHAPRLVDIREPLASGG